MDIRTDISSTHACIEEERGDHVIARVAAEEVGVQYISWDREGEVGRGGDRDVRVSLLEAACKYACSSHPYHRCLLLLALVHDLHDGTMHAYIDALSRHASRQATRGGGRGDWGMWKGGARGAIH